MIWIIVLAWLIIVIGHAFLREKYTISNNFKVNTEEYHSLYLLPTVVIFYNKKIWCILDEYQFTNIRREEHDRILRIEIFVFRTIITNNYRIKNIIKYDGTE